MWELIDKKTVMDSDGFTTEYAWYKEEGTEDNHIMIFGDTDLYDPNSYDVFPDAEFDSYTTAKEWYDNYEGFDEDDLPGEYDFADDMTDDEMFVEDIDISAFEKKDDEPQLLTEINEDSDLDDTPYSKMVIYNDPLRGLCMTDEDNYNTPITNARQVQKLDQFTSFEDVVSYMVNFCNKDASMFINKTQSSTNESLMNEDLAIESKGTYMGISGTTWGYVELLQDNKQSIKVKYIQVGNGKKVRLEDVEENIEAMQNDEDNFDPPMQYCKDNADRIKQMINSEGYEVRNRPIEDDDIANDNPNKAFSAVGNSGQRADMTTSHGLRNESFTDMKEDFGGAFDIDSQLQITRDDLIEFENAVEDRFNDAIVCNAEFSKTDCALHVYVTDKEYFDEGELFVKSFGTQKGTITPRHIMKCVDECVAKINKEYEQVKRDCDITESLMGVLTESSTMPYVDFVYQGTAPSDEEKKDLQWLQIKDGVKSIDAEAFINCPKLQGVEIADTVQVICDRAFKDCKNLQSVKFSKNLVAIGAEAFCNTKIGTAEFGDAVQEIKDSAFQGCSALSKVVIPKSLKKMGNHIFRYCNDDTFTDLEYKGTKSEWAKIPMGMSWCGDSSIEKIICADGEVPKDYEESFKRNNSNTSLTESYSVKYGRGSQAVEFDTIDKAIEHINTGMKKQEHETYILYNDNKEMIWLDYYRDQANNGLGYTISRQNDKGVKFDKNNGLSAVQASNDDADIRGMVVKELGSMGKINVGSKLAKFKFVADTSKPSILDIPNATAYYNKDEQLQKICQTYVSQFTEQKTESIDDKTLTEATPILLNDEQINNPNIAPDFKKMAQDAHNKDVADAQAKEKAEKLANLNIDFSGTDEEIIRRLSDDLMPGEGTASTIAGEMLSAINRIEYRFYNDGDYFFYDYGIETCGAAATFLGENGCDCIDKVVKDCEDYFYEAPTPDEIDTDNLDTTYTHFIKELFAEVVALFKNNPDWFIDKPEAGWRTCNAVYEVATNFTVEIPASDDLMNLIYEGYCDSWALQDYVRNNLSYCSYCRNCEIERPFDYRDTSVIITGLSAQGYEEVSTWENDPDNFWAGLVEEIQADLPDEDKSDEPDDED